MFNLITVSQNYKKQADQLLSDKGLAAFLATFGSFSFTGAYAHDIMMSGDIDILISKPTGYSNKEVLAIFNSLYLANNFRSYFLKGDWQDPRLGQEFPIGYYIGLKEKIKEESWKIDIWFVSTAEAKRLEKTDLLSKKRINEKEKALILKIKKYRQDNNLSFSSQTIYQAVLEQRIVSFEDFIKRIKV